MIERLDATEAASPHRMGMLLFIASEAVFFALLILTYVYYRGAWVNRPGAGADQLAIGPAAVFTGLLLLSSLTVWRAEHHLRHGRPARMRGWLLLTILLGAVFLAGQVWEYSLLIAEGVTINSGLFGTTFYTVTGFHGLHVLGGLIALTVIYGLAQGGVARVNTPPGTALETTSLYWHFVDAVWIVVFSVIYLWALVS
jgi:heme/copper-type cytochrome/quinol oxidase subunit 3